MAVHTGQLFNGSGDGTTAIDTILTQEANRIGQDIYRRTLNTSPWMDLIKQEAFPDGMGYTLGTLIYDRALPTSDTTGNTLAGSTIWQSIGADTATAKNLNSSVDQLLVGATDTNIGPNQANGKGYVAFSRQLKQYSLQRAVVESPKINVEDLRFAAYRTEQLRAIMDSMTESTKYSWEERYRDQYDAFCPNLVICLTASTTVATKAEGTNTSSLTGVAGATATLSNKILDSIYFKLVRAGAGTNAYGRENARPVFGLVCSSEASYSLIAEAGIRDDYRYNQSKVSDLIAPLGIERSHRGFYHLIDDMAPRFTFNSGTGAYARQQPYTASGGVITLNASYETADYEAAFVLHQDVMVSQIPNPISGGNGLTFDPVNYRGKFAWKNIPSADLNPDGTIGFFRGVLASATKPIRTEFGYVFILKRTATAGAA